ncbi:hypothetical protein LCGC14_1608370 [marine sediment metagenome]|uniref:Lipoprotein n=1 Tax=marine sediment metagenome TaxID=412755 RepID=A0A0F9KPY0_9ZZZZ
MKGHQKFILSTGVVWFIAACSPGDSSTPLVIQSTPLVIQSTPLVIQQEEPKKKIPPKKKTTITYPAPTNQAEITRKVVRENLRGKEIPAFQYMVVEGWVQLYPEVREKVKTMLSDDEIITWDEYKVLDNFVSGDLADRQAEKVRDDWKNRIKSHIENSSR